MSLTSPSDHEYLEWLVKKRSDIQVLSHKIVKLLEDWVARLGFSESRTTEALRRQRVATLLAGTAFSLWRSVFLSREAYGFDKNTQAAIDYLKKVIRDNAITYADDLSHRPWVVWYYSNNARFRLLHILKIDPAIRTMFDSITLEKLEDIAPGSGSPQSEWELSYATLDRIAELFELHYVKG